MSEESENTKTSKRKHSKYVIDQEFRTGFQNNFYYVNQVLAERTLPNGRTQCYVSWEGWPAVYNSWVYTDTVMPIDQLLRNIQSTIPSSTFEINENGCSINEDQLGEKKQSQLFQEDTYADQVVANKLLSPSICQKNKIKKARKSKSKLKSNIKQSKFSSKNTIKKKKLSKINQSEEQRLGLTIYFESLQNPPVKEQQSQKDENIYSIFSSQTSQYPTLKKNQENFIQTVSISSNTNINNLNSKEVQKNHQQIVCIQDDNSKPKDKKALNHKNKLNNQLIIDLAEINDFQLSKISIDNDFSNLIPNKKSNKKVQQQNIINKSKNKYNKNQNSQIKQNLKSNKKQQEQINIVYQKITPKNNQILYNTNNQKQKSMKQSQRNNIQIYIQKQNPKNAQISIINKQKTDKNQQNALNITKQFSFSPDQQNIQQIKSSFNSQAGEKKKKITLSSLFKGTNKGKVGSVLNKNIHNVSESKNQIINNSVNQSLLLQEHSRLRIFPVSTKNNQESLLLLPTKQKDQQQQKFSQNKIQQTNLLNNTVESQQNKINQLKRNLIDNTQQYSLLLTQSILQNQNNSVTTQQHPHNLNNSLCKSLQKIIQKQQENTLQNDQELSNNKKETYLFCDSYKGQQSQSNSNQFGQVQTSQNFNNQTHQSQSNESNQRSIQKNQYNYSDQSFTQSQYNQRLNNYYRRLYPELYENIKLDSKNKMNRSQNYTEKQLKQKNVLQESCLPLNNASKQFSYDFQQSSFENDPSDIISEKQKASILSDDESQPSNESSSNHNEKQKIMQYFIGNFGSKDNINTMINDSKKNAQKINRKSRQQLIQIPNIEVGKKASQQKYKSQRQEIQNMKNIPQNSNKISNSNAVIFQETSKKKKCYPQINDSSKRNSNQALKHQIKKKSYPVHDIRLLKQ